MTQQDLSSYSSKNHYFQKLNYGSRHFSTYAPKPKKNQHIPKPKYVKPFEVGAFAPTQEPIIQLENGYYLLYYHRQRPYTMLLLYLKLLIPLFIVFYIIKKNPFYKSYPVVLPFWIASLFYFMFKFMRYGSVTNRMIHQILLDPSGTEATFIYKNRMARKLRSDNLEQTELIQSLVNPPQENEYTPLKGQLFPEEYPFNFDIINDINYFWMKYYISQHMFFSIAKRPHYVNYEILCNIFATKSVDFSQAKIYKVHSTKFTRFEFEFILESLNKYSRMAFADRKQRADNITKMIEAYKQTKPEIAAQAESTRNSRNNQTSVNKTGKK